MRAFTYVLRYVRQEGISRGFRECNFEHAGVRGPLHASDAEVKSRKIEAGIFCVLQESRRVLARERKRECRREGAGDQLKGESSPASGARIQFERRTRGPARLSYVIHLRGSSRARVIRSERNARLIAPRRGFARPEMRRFASE